MHWQFSLRVLPSAVYYCNWRKNSIIFIMAFAHFSLKARITNRSQLINWYFYCGLFSKEFVSKYCSFLYGKVRGKTKFTNHIKFSPQNCVFYRMVIQTVLKQPMTIEYLIKQKPGGALALQVNRISDRRVSLKR